MAASLGGVRRARVARACFHVAAVGCVLAAIFPMDFPGSPRTTSGALHAAGGILAFPPWVLGTLLFTSVLRTDTSWGPRRGMLVGLAGAGVAVLAIQIASMAILGFGGYAQRALLALLFAWLIASALGLMRAPRTA
jgi:hypothetical protein